MQNSKTPARRSGVRGKLFFASLGLMLAGGAVFGIYLEGLLHSFLQTRIQTDLIGHARTVAETLVLNRGPHALSMQALACKLGEASGYRVTLID
ncbi:MAG: hypothetical protein AAF449_00235, partial [Myxococcota bacterium]